MFKLIDPPKELSGALITEENLNSRIMEDLIIENDKKGLTFMGCIGGKLLFKNRRYFLTESKP